MIGIYKITNPIGQVYIGQSKDIKKRFTYYTNKSCKKTINCQNNTIVKQSVRGGSCGYWINNQFIKRKDLNSFLELIPKKEFLPF